MSRNIYAYTGPTGSYPEYISVNEAADGKVEITVRNPLRLSGSRPEDRLTFSVGTPIAGDTAAITLTQAQVLELYRSLRSRSLDWVDL